MLLGKSLLSNIGGVQQKNCKICKWRALIKYKKKHVYASFLFSENMILYDSEMNLMCDEVGFTSYLLCKQINGVFFSQ